MLRILTAAVVGALISLPTLAQTVCGERGDFLGHLSNSYHERPVAMGLVSNGALLEVLASDKGSWTIIVTRPDGTSCVVAAGEAWEDLPRLVSGPAA
jgi:hypothetical protein